MHNKNTTEYEDFFPDMLRETAQCAELARAAGIPDDKIILDPGIGFGKTLEMNLETLHYLEPVSYTHLDVYKRQVVCCFSRAEPGLGGRSAGYRCRRHFDLI